MAYVPDDVHFADDFQPDFGLDWVPPPSIERAHAMTDDELREMVEAREDVKRRAEMDPVEWGWRMPSWKRVQEAWKKYKIHVILGGNRCLGPDSLIDRPDGPPRKVSEIKGHHTVFAWDGRKIVTAKAEQPYIKAYGPVYEIRLSNGLSFQCSALHRVLTAKGYVYAFELSRGDVLAPAGSTLGVALSGHLQGGARYSHRAEGSQGDCHPSPRSCGEQPHQAEADGQGGSPSQVDAPTRIEHDDSICRSPLLPGACSLPRRSGARGSTPSRSHVSQESARPSTLGGLLRRVVRFAGTGFRASYTACRSVLALLVGLAPWRAFQQSSIGSFLRKSTGALYESGSESCLRLPYSNQISLEVTGIKYCGFLPIWDFGVERYHNYVCAGAVHHNSSKSSFASRLMMWGARTIPEFEGRCWHVNEDRSIEDQQRFMWEALPYQYKNLSRKKGPNYSVQYTQKNGFTGNVLILPPSVQGAQRGGTIKFNNYRQYQQDAQIAEGFKSHIIWMDEEAPQKLFETMLPRLIDYHGRLVLTFTTLQGWTPLIADILGKVRVLEKRYATLLGEPIPYVMESESRNGSVVWCFWTEDNPFVDGNELANVLKGRPRSEIKARAYGLPDRGTEAKFPKFQRDVNVVPHAEVPFIKNPKQHVTRYVSLDPAGSKSWFMIWAALDALGRIWIYREWPDVGFGDWVEPSSKLEGKPGPAQKNPGYGINDYVEMIKEAEKGEVVLDRFIDPRMGAAITQGEDGAETIISKLDDAGLVFQPAPGKDIADGEALINDVLAWDESRKRDSTNSPRLFISDACGNLIHAMENYMGIGQDEPCKDPIDCLRYLLQSAPDYVAPGGVVGKRRGGY